MAICAGHGGLELGIRLALGERYRTVCYVEREAYAAACLVARMGDQALDIAPIWDDLRSFDGRPWRGRVDLVSGGYPCQPESVAGKRLGADDPRWLWNDVSRVVGEIRPRYVFFENVAAHLAGTFPTVLRDLWGLGYRVAAGIFSAEEVGAPHLRERLFILGELADGAGGGFGADGWTPGCGGHADIGGGELADARRRSDDAHSLGRWAEGDAYEQAAESYRSIPLFPPAPSDVDGWLRVLAADASLSPALGKLDACGVETAIGRAMRGVIGGRNRRARRENARVFSESFIERVLEEETESAIRKHADGLACRVDELRGSGNGVLPLVAAKALVCLAGDLAAGRHIVISEEFQ